VQQRALAQNVTTADSNRRLEGEVAIANIPRQKVRISRQRMLESALKVMNLYAGGNTILEVEFAGEVGTGSGPTLEFYALVGDILRTSEPRLFRKSAPGGFLFPEPLIQGSSSNPAQALIQQQVVDRFRLLGQTVAKCILDNRLVDLQLHPYFWRLVLDAGPFSTRSLREIDAELFNSISGLPSMADDALAGLCIDFTLPGHPDIELKPGGAGIPLTRANVDEYITAVSEMSLVTACGKQVSAFRKAFAELLPLETCRIWSERELSSLIVGSPVWDDSAWTLEHLSAHIKTQHGYNAESRCFRDLVATMVDFTPEERRKFVAFVTGAPTLPVDGFAGLKPPLTVVKKEAPPAPLTPDNFMPSVMTCANYLKLPEYSSAKILRERLNLATSEGQQAFLLS
jgi:E3 ubiquitin-protein ligase TRIP12